jgi:hypothetical protein
MSRIQVTTNRVLEETTLHSVNARHSALNTMRVIEVIIDVRISRVWNIIHSS